MATRAFMKRKNKGRFARRMAGYASRKATKYVARRMGLPRFAARRASRFVAKRVKRFF